MKKITTISLALIAGGLIGCTNMTPQQQGTMSGAAIGAAAGAGIAAIAGGSGWTGAAVGAPARSRQPRERQATRDRSPAWG